MKLTPVWWIGHPCAPMASSPSRTNGIWSLLEGPWTPKAPISPKWCNFHQISQYSVIFTEVSSSMCDGVSFLPRLQKHRKRKQNKGISDAPLTSDMLNSTTMMWFLMNPFHFHGNGRKSGESTPLLWNWAFWRSAGHQEYLCFACVSHGFAARGGKGIHLD